MTVAERVKFCEDCFGAFDVPVNGRRTPEICEECKRERKRQANRRMVQARSAMRAERRMTRAA